MSTPDPTRTPPPAPLAPQAGSPGEQPPVHPDVAHPGVQPHAAQQYGGPPQGTQPQGTQPQGTQPQGVRPYGAGEYGAPQASGAQASGVQASGAWPPGAQLPASPVVGAPAGVAGGWGPVQGQPYGQPMPASLPQGWGEMPPAQQSPYPRAPQVFHHFWRAPRWRWWKSVVILLVGGVAFMLLQTLALFGAAAVDDATGRVPWSHFVDELRHNSLQTTPAFFIANNISLDLLVPLAILLAWAVVRQKPAAIVSVEGRVRWGWLWRCMAWIAPLWIALAVVQYLAARSDPSTALHVTHDTWPLVLGIVLTTPLQCAGEEFAFRGIVNRSVASWFPNEWVGFAAGGLVNSALFMLAHGAGDPWLNVFYFVFGFVGTWLARRTGGLEASIAVHVINNVTAEWMMPFTNISGMFDRGAGTAGPGVLINGALPLLAVLIIEWRARREHIVNRATPEPQPPAQSGGICVATAWPPPALP